MGSKFKVQSSYKFSAFSVLSVDKNGLWASAHAKVLLVSWQAFKTQAVCLASSRTSASTEHEGGVSCFAVGSQADFDIYPILCPSDGLGVGMLNDLAILIQQTYGDGAANLIRVPDTGGEFVLLAGFDFGQSSQHHAGAEGRPVALCAIKFVLDMQ